MIDVLITILVGIGLILINSLITKYLEPKLPSKDKALIIGRKIFLFTGKYIFNVAGLIYWSIELEFSKLFVFAVVYFSCVITYFLVGDFVYSVNMKFLKSLSQDMKEKAIMKNQ